MNECGGKTAALQPYEDSMRFLVLAALAAMPTASHASLTVLASSSNPAFGGQAVTLP